MRKSPTLKPSPVSRRARSRGAANEASRARVKGEPPEAARAFARRLTVDMTKRCDTDLALLDLRGAVTKTTLGRLARLLAGSSVVEAPSASSTCIPDPSESGTQGRPSDASERTGPPASRQAAHGGGGGTRTHDERLKRPLLYRLSYAPEAHAHARRGTGAAQAKGGGRAAYGP